MAIPSLSKFRNALLTTVALLGVGLPLCGMIAGGAAIAQMPNQKSGRHHHQQMTINLMQPDPNSDPDPDPDTSTTLQPAMKKAPALMESYFFNYQYANKPIINGGPTPEGYLGSGFAAVGTYKIGQTITITDNFGRPVGTYTIGTVNNSIPLNANQLNTVTVSEYDYNLGGAPVTTRVIAGTGLVANVGTKGLGSESGLLNGHGAEGTSVSFNNQHTAINPIHF